MKVFFGTVQPDAMTGHERTKNLLTSAALPRTGAALELTLEPSIDHGRCANPTANGTCTGYGASRASSVDLESYLVLAPSSRRTVACPPAVSLRYWWGRRIPE